MFLLLLVICFLSIILAVSLRLWISIYEHSMDVRYNNQRESLMKTSQSAVLMGKKERKVKYIHKNFKYIKPMVREKLKSTGFLIVVEHGELQKQTSEGMVFVAKFLYILWVEGDREYLRKAFYSCDAQNEEMLIR